MRVALVHDWLTGLRGGEKCLEPFCRRFPEAPLFTLLHRRGSTSPAIERMAISTSPLGRLPGVDRYYRYLLPAMPWAVESLRLPRELDVVLSFSHAVAKGVGVPEVVPHVCYCFTPMRYAWHLRDEYFSPAHGRPWRPALVDLPRDLVLDRLRAWDRAASDRVTHFVAISHTVARRIAECYGRTSRVVYPPVDTRFFTPGRGARGEHYLVVSALVPYKRIDLAIEACRSSGRKLVIIGAGPERRRLERLGRGTATLLGWTSRTTIRDHLRRCRALLFPGLEDFGIVPVEAQACGTPVIALAAGGAIESMLPATAEQTGTGVCFSERSAAALAEAMRWFESHPDRCSPELARSSAERFSADRFERELLAIVEQAASGTLPSQASPQSAIGGPVYRVPELPCPVAAEA